MGAIHFSIDRELLAFFKHALPLERFVETGTFRGDSLETARSLFRECHSVEMSPALHAAARTRFATEPGVQLHFGDSPGFLRAHHAEFSGTPTLFWLDAHWCVAGDTAGEQSQSPLLAELRALQPLHPQSVVLIDDARLYLAAPPKPHRLADWPDLADVLTAWSGPHRLMVLNDVLIFYPAVLRERLAAHAHACGVDWLTLARHAQSYARRKKSRFCWPWQQSGEAAG